MFPPGHYRLVAEGLIPHTAPAYRRLSPRLAQARWEERFPDLVDPLHEVQVPPAWPDAGAFLRAAPDWFALDRTAGQTTTLYVACEKNTLRAQLTGWLEDTAFPCIVRGFGSQSYVQVVRERTARDPRPAVLLYVGDFDARGPDRGRRTAATTAQGLHGGMASEGGVSN
ncbi:hypothetical protein ACFWIO_17120 [Streptomyces diastatochromogenes]|uniref:hypothetical protein n=1 Tax=Streptomyces diastatochromogenes TaxID=42236 RepID=UPI00366053CD